MNTQPIAQQIIVITGANSGIGREVARSLYKQGHIVIFGARNIHNNTQATTYIQYGHTKPAHQLHKQHKQHKQDKQDKQLKDNQGYVYSYKLDLCNRQSIQQFVEHITTKIAQLKCTQPSNINIDILINNAGLLGQNQLQLQNNLQLTLLANHFGHFYLTYLLMPYIKSSKQGRIINVSSDIHYKIKYINQQKGDKLQKDQYNIRNIWDTTCENKMYDSLQQYAVSKFYNVLFTLGLQQYINNHKLNIKSVCLHPGFVDTNFGSFSQLVKNIKKLYGQYMITPETGSIGTLALCCRNYDQLKAAEYYNEKAELRDMNVLCRNQDHIHRLWQISQKLYDIQWNREKKKEE